MEPHSSPNPSAQPPQSASVPSVPQATQGELAKPQPAAGQEAPTVPLQPVIPLSGFDAWLCAVGGRIVAAFILLLMFGSVLVMGWMMWMAARWIWNA